MMVRFVNVMAGLLILPSFAAAQQAPSGDQQQQILQLLQGMNDKFERMEKRLDALENPPAESADAIPAKPAAGRTKVTPGWQIELFPYGKDGPQELSIARAHVPIGELPFKLSLKDGPVSNFVQYRAKALFRAASSGKYGFRITMDSTSHNTRFLNPSLECVSQINLDDREVLAPEWRKTDFAASGGVELDAGTYELSYTVSCTGFLEKLSYTPNKNTIEIARNTTINVQVIGPDDDDFRVFEPSELYTTGK
ncbi:hypothetical protein LRX75_22635 [Rhizobium sp. DKSPLA3]|uniref:Uncharacterized protein n=1 Tax=Rhizobium quercicola TaxID=2901226 RepID=A0A9X1NYX9_9HYPH|nr:hypothetical protein [Rhizobium quercicola]MCD7111828.1 hypothetical protein [Rhizobium quercicola]